MADTIEINITVVQNEVDGRIIGGDGGSVEPNVTDPTRDYGAPLDAETVITEELQNALNAAKKPLVAGFGYGSGGRTRLQVGVPRFGPVFCPRDVTLVGSGPLAGTTGLADYSSLEGVAGEDALISMLDDGTSQRGITQQQSFQNFALDGRRGVVSAGIPVGHVRHGIAFVADDDPDEEHGTDRVATLHDLHVMNMPGASFYIFKNGQVRGGNIKATGSQWGIYAVGVKDGKLAQVGLGKNVGGNVLQDCASLKIKDIDAWTGPECDGSPVLSVISCAKCQFEGGEIEGLVLVSGDNAETNNKSYREEVSNVFPDINFKISQDWWAAAGDGDMTTGAGYVALVKVLDANGVGLRHTTGKYKKGIPESKIGNPDYQGRHMEYTPNCFVWFGTSIDPEDDQYDDWLAACGDADMTGATFMWHRGKGFGGRKSIPIVPFKEHISNYPGKIRGLRLGQVTLRPTGTQNADEIPLAGSVGNRTYTSDYYPLLYLRTDPNWGSLEVDHTARRKLTDRDAEGPGSDPVTGYVTFTVDDLSASAPIGYTYYMVFEQ